MPPPDEVFECRVTSMETPRALEMLADLIKARGASDLTKVLTFGIVDSGSLSSSSSSSSVKISSDNVLACLELNLRCYMISHLFESVSYLRRHYRIAEVL